MEIKLWDIGKLKPYEKNAKKHDEKQIANVANCIKRFGWTQPIVADENGVVVIGHCRLEAAKSLGLSKVPVVIKNDLTEKQIKELRIADNKTNESPWDFALLEEDIEGLDFEGFDFDFGLDDANQATEGNPYTEKTMVPQYEPTGEDAKISCLVDDGKTKQLIEEIEENPDLTSEEKDFLKLAAYRHLVFNYKKIANYYAVASAEMQNFMERSALVIIDYDDAIANGYATLSVEIDDMLKGDVGE